MGKVKRNVGIDVIKGLAILSVILLHIFDTEKLLKIGAPFHVWQAVPVFMILLGYNNAHSYRRHHFEKPHDFLEPTYIRRRFLGIILPAIIIYVIELLILFMFFDKDLIRDSLYENILKGGWGPGSYYVPLIIQAYFIMPILYMAAKRIGWKQMLVYSGLFNLFMEIFSRHMGIPEGIYRILIIRFIFAIALGIALSFTDISRSLIKKLIPPALFSLIYIVGVMYFDVEIVMEKYWHSQHLFGFFWPLLLLTFAIYYDFSRNNKLVKVLQYLGKRSYYIYLVQMLYFWSYLDMNLSLTLWTILLDYIVCIAGGVLFFKWDQRFFSGEII